MKKNNFDKVVKKTKLPDWLNVALAEELTLSEAEKNATSIFLSWRKGLFYTTLSDDKGFDTLDEAYESLSQEQRHGHLIFDKESLKEHGSLLFDSDNTSFLMKDSCRLLMGKNDHNTDTIELLKYAYHEWVNEINPAYQKNPKDWFLAYEWLTNHPSFWIREYDKKRRSHWVTDNGIETTRSFVYKKGKRKEICIETGSHVGPEYTTRYLDIDITVRETTFEKAYIKLAEKINKEYKIDGSDK